jgi:hypothetical protein
MTFQAGSASSIPHLRVPQTPMDTNCTDGVRGGEVEPDFSEIEDAALRMAVVAAYEGWARKYPELLEDWPA